MHERTSLAVDIGGTFTDVVLIRQGTVFVEKTLTTPGRLLDCFTTGVRAVLAKAAIAPADVDGAIVHATTVVTNALIERRGSRTAMVFTRGFADILEIRDSRRYDMYDPQIEFPKPLVEREDILSVAERVHADGSVGAPLPASEIDAVCERLAATGVASVGICLLHGYRNGVHERALAQAIGARCPGVHVSISSEVAPQIREYWRASTTSVNAYAAPVSAPYLTALAERLADAGFPTRPLIMLSSGGIVGSETAARFPVRMIESGPAAGALGAAYLARLLEARELIAFDMGGTTAKVCLIQEAKPLITGLFEIDRMYRFKEGSGLPVTVPSVDLIEIGAGGGSIARVDELGLLKVGPRSAGAEPGPACYGKGGREPTVTDADVVLGLVDPASFLGGAMRLDADAARAAIGTVADRLGMDAMATARGIYQLVCESMAGAVRAHAADRGVDYRGIPMLAFGGAGPVHACAVADVLSCSSVVFPRLASVFSSFGSLVTPMKLDIVQSALSRLGALAWDETDAMFDRLEAEGRRVLVDAGCVPRDVAFRYAADMRYLGQQFEISVDLDRRPGRDPGAGELRAAFERQYLKRYRLVQERVEVEVVTWRVTATVSDEATPAVETRDPAPAGARPPRARRVHLWQPDQVVPAVHRADLRPDDRVDGPAIIEEPDTTIVIPPGWRAMLGPAGAIVARRTAATEVRR